MQVESGFRKYAVSSAGAPWLQRYARALGADPDIMLIAEDHSGWDRVTQPAETGGIGALVGTQLGLKWLPVRMLRYALGVVLLIAAGKLLFG